MLASRVDLKLQVSVQPALGFLDLPRECRGREGSVSVWKNFCGWRQLPKRKSTAGFSSSPHSVLEWCLFPETVRKTSAAACLVTCNVVLDVQVSVPVLLSLICLL